jgi:hypothetical protein
MVGESQRHSASDQFARTLAVIALITPFVLWGLERYWPNARAFRAQLVTNTTEVIYADSRYLALTISNDGNEAAKEVTAVIETYQPGFTFDEVIHEGHTHVNPPSDATITVRRKKVIVELGAPLGEKQRVSILIDRLPVPGNMPAMFHVSVTSEQGLSEVASAFDYRNDRHSTADFGLDTPDDFVSLD